MNGLKKTAFIILGILLCTTQLSIAQSSTDIWLFELTKSDELIEVSDPVNITDREGYDNQPFFHPDGRSIYYTSQRGEQTDIYQYAIKKGKRTQITATETSEYSPTMLPDRSGLSMIMVEADGTQRLWKYTFKKEEWVVLADDLKPVGYHAWHDPYNFVAFILGEPASLYTYNIGVGESERIYKGIGRSIHKIPMRPESSFVDNTKEVSVLRSYDGHFDQTKEICDLLPGSQDLAWVDQHLIVMANEKGLYVKDTNSNYDWTRVSDLSELEGKNPTRIAVDPNGRYLAIVLDR